MSNNHSYLARSFNHRLVELHHTYLNGNLTAALATFDAVRSAGYVSASLELNHFSSSPLPLSQPPFPTSTIDNNIHAPLASCLATDYCTATFQEVSWVHKRVVGLDESVSEADALKSVLPEARRRKIRAEWQAETIVDVHNYRKSAATNRDYGEELWSFVVE